MTVWPEPRIASREEARADARRAAAQRHHEAIWPALEAHVAAIAEADRVASEARAAIQRAQDEARAAADAVLADAETLAMDAYRVELARIDAEYPEVPDA